MSELNDRTVLVTGAFGSLGEVVAQAFANADARVALLGRASTPRIAARFPAPHLLLEGVDLTDARQVGAALDKVRERFGHLDILVNVAGGFRWEKLEHGHVETWDQMYSINLKTAVTVTSAALPLLLASAPGSRIVNVGSGAANRVSAAGMGAYAASKAGVQKLTESLADEFKDRGVTVNAVLPGTIDTPQNRADMPDADVSSWVAPQAIADLILFLASPRAAAITGAAVPVFGRG
jgi:NAD(P)-dependent dehydrogenase (short-subunit alcohol dehydrogenase family)